MSFGAQPSHVFENPRMSQGFLYLVFFVSFVDSAEVANCCDTNRTVPARSLDARRRSPVSPPAPPDLYGCTWQPCQVRFR